VKPDNACLSARSDRITNMADDTGSDIECSAFITTLVTERSEVSCMCCDELKIELTRTLSELKSALEIIKIKSEGHSDAKQ
jgi:hypothetical protein